MHFEILVEDLSGKKALDILLPKIIGNKHTFNIHSYKGCGRIPKGISTSSEANKRILLDQLPRLFCGYGRTYNANHNTYPVAVILVCDLDNKSLEKFLLDLGALLNNCNPQPRITKFCIAIEEGEAWLLGDLQAVRSAYPKANIKLLDNYVNDSICGTWETLANAVYPGGAIALSSKGWQAIGAEKSQWAEKITPHVNVEKNVSPSFKYFKDVLHKLAGIEL
ncbi:hypothetical protein [Desulfovibrio cuneatus]|uniref:hypothetical protein n=1 Tax=Desulfovibrio cuneatus TaxID=159728 RepID=UPI0004865F6E|nr:hypothetical protein [Desulfovibrio cuneatus]